MDKILFIFAILQYKFLYMVMDSAGFDETGWKPGCLKPNYVVVWGRWMQWVGPEEIKPHTRTIIETITALYSISYNPHFQRNNREWILLKYMSNNFNFKLSSRWFLIKNPNPGFVFGGVRVERDREREGWGMPGKLWNLRGWQKTPTSRISYSSFLGGGRHCWVAREGKGRCWQASRSNYFHMWHTLLTLYTLV